MHAAAIEKPSIDDLVDSAIQEAQTVLPRISELRPRESRVVSYISEGSSNKDIALKMGITERSVENCINTINSNLFPEPVGGRKLAFVSVFYSIAMNGRFPQLIQEADNYSGMHFRQQQMLQMIGIGMRNQEIADWMGLSIRTIENYSILLSEIIGLPRRRCWVYCAEQAFARYKSRKGEYAVPVILEEAQGQGNGKAITVMNASDIRITIDGLHDTCAMPVIRTNALGGRYTIEIILQPKGNHNKA